MQYNVFSSQKNLQGIEEIIFIDIHNVLLKEIEGAFSK